MGALPAKKLEIDAAPSGQADDRLEVSDEAIRERSKEIWEREGRPDGLADEHWNRARAELAELLARTSNAPRPDADEPAQGETAPPQPAESACDPSEELPHDEQAEAADDVGPVEPDAPVLDEEAAQPETSSESRPALPADCGPRARVPSPPPGWDDRRSRFERRTAVPSIISAGIEFHGMLQSPGDIQFDGAIEGTLCGTSLVVDKNGLVRGDVIGDDVVVRGRINGRISAQQVILRAGCRVEGEIFYRSLAVEIGAELDGTFHRLDSAGDSEP